MNNPVDLLLTLLGRRCVTTAWLLKHPRMPIQLPLRFQNVSTSLAVCRWSTQSILISLWTVQAISIPTIFDAAEPHSFLTCLVNAMAISWQLRKEARQIFSCSELC